MQIGEWLTVAALTIGLVGSGGAGLKFYGDTQWVTVGAYQLGELRQLEREIKNLELENNLSDKDQAYLEFLKLQAEQMQQEIK